jgi:signal transduction histidine kinase
MLAVPYNDLVRDLPASQRALQRAIAVARTQGRNSDRAVLHRQQSTVTSLTGLPDSALYHALAAVDLFRAEGDRAMLGVSLCDVGHLLKRRDLPRAFGYYREGLAILEALDARGELVRAYNNYAPLHELEGNIDSALYFARKGLALVEQLNDSTGLPYSLNRTATYLLHHRRYEEARELMLRAETIRRALHDAHGLADQQVYFGDLYQAWGRCAEAVPFFVDGVRRARALNYPYLEQYCHERLAECHETLGDHAAALAATRSAHAVKDSLLNEKNSRSIVELEQRYRVAEKDRTIAELEAAAARRRLLLWLGAALLVLLAVSGALGHQLRQRRLRAERDAAVIAEREAGLKAVFEATERERRRLAAELHDGIGQQLGGLKHRLEHLKHRLPHNGATGALDEVLRIVDDTSHEVRALAHQMMPKALSRLGLVPAMQEMLERAFNGGGVELTFGHHGVSDDIRPELAVGLYRIAQELVTNILKHAGAMHVDVQLLRNAGHLVLVVQDDGRGLGNAPPGSGIGLRNIADRARALGGDFRVETAGENGTVATVRVPIGTTVAA